MRSHRRSHRGREPGGGALPCGSTDEEASQLAAQGGERPNAPRCTASGLGNGATPLRSGRLNDSGPPHSGDHLYVHIPYCRDRCTYCAFTTTPDDPTTHGEFVEAVLSEWRRIDRESAPRTVSLGGGTPGLLSAERLRALITSITTSKRSLTPFEITLEVNPSNVTAGALAEWADIGVTRLSVGIQTLDNSALHHFARLHDRSQALSALELIQGLWAHTWSADLLVGWSGQSAAQLAGDLDTLLGFTPPHVSIYGLTVEPGTPLARQAAKGGAVQVDREAAAELDELWTERLIDSGLERYEVSNFARPGHECVHNQAYWHGHSYRGLGPGASSSEGSWRWTNRRDVSAWMAAARSGLSVREHVEALTAEQRLLELLGSGLRTREGLDPTGLDERFGSAWRPPFEQAAEDLLAGGLLQLGSDRLGIAPAALSRADRILVELVQRWPSAGQEEAAR
jgi:oxygen-independent coproporphyrinogen-3 oxidase